MMQVNADENDTNHKHATNNVKQPAFDCIPQSSGQNKRGHDIFGNIKQPIWKFFFHEWKNLKYKNKKNLREQK